MQQVTTSVEYAPRFGKLDSGTDKLTKYNGANRLYPSFTFLGREDAHKFLRRIINDGGILIKAMSLQVKKCVP